MLHRTIWIMLSIYENIVYFQSSNVYLYFIDRYFGVTVFITLLALIFSKLMQTQDLKGVYVIPSAQNPFCKLGIIFYNHFKFIKIYGLQSTIQTHKIPN